MARLQLQHIRTLAVIMQDDPNSSVVTDFITTPGSLEPLAYTAKQTAVPLAQAEGWLGMCLVARLPYGACTVARLFEDDEMLDALRLEIKGHSEGEFTDATRDSAASPTRRGSVPGWVQEKERANAMVLAHDLLKSREVVEPLRGRLETVLKDANISLFR